MDPSHPHHGRPDEEMFLDPNQKQDVPIVGPLRIQKTLSSSSSPAPQANSSSSTAAPLPYPDDRFPPKSSTPEAARRRADGTTSSSSTMPFGSGGSPRPHFSANDPNRPSAAYGHAPGRASPAQS